MKKRSTIRLWMVPALLALLLLVTTAGVTFHHHANSNDANCSVCHFSHQSADLQVANASITHLGAAGSSPDIPEPQFVPAPVAQRLPARAPPIA